MANIRVRTRESQGYQIIRTMVPAEEQKRFGDLELDSKMRFIEPGDDNSLQLFEIDYLPHTDIEIHAHREDEIIYIVDGAMHVGARILGPGATVFVKGNTLYGFKAGPDGLRMLNFRPRADRTFIRKADFRRGATLPAAWQADIERGEPPAR